ncbi:hypothetical protein AB3S75_006613 [Citrus x aurantiifolia]
MNNPPPRSLSLTLSPYASSWAKKSKIPNYQFLSSSASTTVNGSITFTTVSGECDFQVAALSFKCYQHCFSSLKESVVLPSYKLS